MNRKSFFVFIAFATLIFFTSCRKNIFDNNPSLQLTFSTDTLAFDTVFTQLGSATRLFKVFNENNNGLRTNVRLAGGDASNFRINVDGSSGNLLSDVEIYGNDSMYVFVEVTVDPNGLNTPLIITDSVIFETNGNIQRVILSAWGQDAFYYSGMRVCDETWFNNDGKPYVIFNSMLVDSSCTLTIQEGVKVYLSPNSRLFVNGTLKINGTAENPVVMQGVRLEKFYENLPGQWEGIHLLRGSTNNEINGAELKNSVVGVRIDSLPVNLQPNLRLKNTKIYNTLSSGILALTAVVFAENCLIFNNGEFSVQLELGGLYDFNHCTFANYGSVTINHQKPVLRMSNYLEASGVLLLSELDATFTNCVVYGSLEEEVEIDPYEDDPSLQFKYILDHCLLRTKRLETDTGFVTVILNQDPRFVEREKDNFNLKEDSPCRGAGKTTTVTTDLNGNSRSNPPDIGAYEFE